MAMRKESVVLACGAACALAAASAAAEIPDYLLLDRAVRGFQGGVQTDTAFAGYYDGLYGASPSAARNFAVMFFWHASGDIRASLYASSGQGQGNPPPPRAGGPVECLTITRFEVTPTSVVIRAEWPQGFPLPFRWLELRGKRDLREEEWQRVGFLDIDKEQGWAEAEFPFDALTWDDLEDTAVPPMAFFKLVVPDDPDEEWWLADEEEEGDGDPPDNPVVRDIIGDGSVELWGYFSPWDPIPTVTNCYHTFEATPGEQYLIVVRCFCVEATVPSLPPEYNLPPIRGTVMSWDVTAPDGQSTAGSITPWDLYAQSQQAGVSPITYFVQDFILYTAPEPPPGPALMAAGAAQATAALTVAEPDYAGHGNAFPGYIAVDHYHVSLTQRNFPNTNSLPNIGSTDFGASYGAYIIPTNGTAFITGEPRAPALTAKVKKSSYSQGDISTSWRLTVKSERPVYRGTLDDRAYPAHGGFTPFVDTPTVDITASLMDNEIVGGKCKLEFKIKSAHIDKTAEGSFPFFIRGMNPTDAAVTNYVNQVMPAFCRPYAWALLQHETKAWAPNGQYFYNQFNPNGSRIYQPNKTDDGRRVDPKTGKVLIIKYYGWGIGQIDNGPVTNGPNAVTTAQVHHWKTNCTASAETFARKKSEYNAMLTRIEESYPNEWVPPPATTNLYGVTWTHEQWAVTVLYNGSTGVKTTKVKSNEKPGKMAEIECPLRFDPKGNPKWTFEDNKTNYAQQIAPYLPPNTPPVAVE